MMQVTSLLKTGWMLCAAAAVACSTLGGCTQQITDDHIKVITTTEVRKMTSEGGRDRGALLVDPRSPQAFAEGHIPGARNVPLTAVSGKKDELPPELASYKNLIVYGENPGSASARALTKRLMSAGHKGVWWYQGGLSEWSRAGGSVRRAESVGETPAEGAS